MTVDLNTKLWFPAEIAIKALRHEELVWSKQVKEVYLIELTVPSEEDIKSHYLLSGSLGSQSTTHVQREQ